MIVHCIFHWIKLSMSVQYMELGSFPKPRCIYFASSLSSLIKTSKPQTALFIRLSILLLLVVLYKLSFPVAKFYHLKCSYFSCNCNQPIYLQKQLPPRNTQAKKRRIPWNKRGVLHVITLTAVNKTQKTWDKCMWKFKPIFNTF